MSSHHTHTQGLIGRNRLHYVSMPGHALLGISFISASAVWFLIVRLSPNLVEEDKTWVTLERRGNGTLHSLRGIPTKWFLLHDPMMTRLLGSAANLDVLIWVQCHQSNWKPTQRLTSLIMVMNSGRLFGALVVADIAYFFRGLFRGPRKLVDLIFVHALIGVNAMKFNVVSIHC